MESEPLVITDKTIRNMNFNITEDGSMLNPKSIDSEKEQEESSAEMTNGGGGGDKEKSTVIDEDHLLLEKFHDEAIQKVGIGKVQFFLFIVSGLVLSADGSEFMATILSSKSAQFEFCVDETQKSWLVGASLMGMAVGSIFWGSLSDKVGRGRAILYSLGFGSIFSLASVIMPTEGTFITARLVSGIGLGACMPLSVTYFSEFIPVKRRKLATSLLFLFWPLGAAYVILVSWFILPSTGFHLNEELKEHFSAWRRLLLASWGPSGVALVAFIFMPEAPLFLMQNGRDEESLEVYKKLHKRNRGASQATLCFSEIEIPTVHLGSSSNNASAFGDLRKALESLWASFLILWTENRHCLTITLSLVWLMTAMGQGALTSWVISHQATLRDWTFNKNVTTYEKAHFNNSSASTFDNRDLINVRYIESSFEDLMFTNIMMNHVKFEHCSFQHVNFTNVKASYVLFKNSELSECTFVDTNLGKSNFQNCSLERNSFASLNPFCHLIPDFSMHLSNDMIDSGLPVLGIFIGTILAVILLLFCPRAKLVSIVLLLAALISIGLTIWTLDPTWALVGHTIINVLIATIWSCMTTTFDKYPTWTKGSALGFCIGMARIGGFFGVGLFGTTLSGILIPIFSSIFLVLASCLAFRGNF